MREHENMLHEIWSFGSDVPRYVRHCERFVNLILIISGGEDTNISNRI